VVIHCCFALAPTPESIVQIFGSKEAGNAEILRHWRTANVNDDEHRIYADKMACKTFDYPYSMPVLLACKAAELQGGQRAHWDYFDRIQKAHLTECRNIVETEVLLDCAREIGLDVKRFQRDLQSLDTWQAVEQDIQRAIELGVYAVPSIVINQEGMVSGAIQYEELENILLNYQNPE